MAWLVLILAVLLITMVLVTILVIWKHNRNRIRNYSCAEAQLVSKKAQKQYHKEMRRHSDKLLYEVLKIIDTAARNRRNDVYTDTSPFEKKFFDVEDARKYRNSVKESLRARGFRIIPDEQRREAVIHVSWHTSHAEGQPSN